MGANLSKTRVVSSFYVNHISIKLSTSSLFVLPGTSVGRTWWSTEFEDERVRKHIKVARTTISVLSAPIVSQLSLPFTPIKQSDCYVVR